MKINVRGQKIKLTAAIKTYAEEKVGRIDKYFDNNEIVATVILKINGINSIVEVTIPTPKFILRAEERNEDMYAAIDLVVDKLERLIRKNKTKLSKKYKDAETREINFEAISELKVEKKNKIVKRKEIELKPMDEEEALLQIELLNHDFFIFNNADEKCFSVIYKRKDGEYGIIDAK